MDFKQQYTKEIDKKVSQFRKAVDKIEKSEDPRLDGREVKDYEISKLRDSLESEVAEINSKYKQEAQGLLEQRKSEAATSYFKPSTYDKEFVGSVLDEFTANVAFAYGDQQKSEAFRSLESRFEHMTPEQLFAVKSQLPKVLQSVSDEGTLKNLRRVNSTLSELKTPAQEALEEAKMLAVSKPDMAFTRLTMTHSAFKDKAKHTSRLKGMSF
jgi:hypothetical protein